MSKVYVGVFDNVTYRSFVLYRNKAGDDDADLFVPVSPNSSITALVLEDGAMRRKVLLWNGKVGWVMSYECDGWSWSEHETST